jgi:phospholipase C
MDAFVQNTENHSCSAPQFCAPGIVMDYYDGNTVTALWNYAQNYAMSDNNWDSTFGPSTPGALNVISGNTSPAHAVDPATGAVTTSPAIPDPDSGGTGSINGDLDPAFDACSDNSHTSTNPLGVVTSKNIGDLLNASHVTWGWFQGGFAPTGTSSAGFAQCGMSHTNIGGAPVTDYVPHHEPFEYYASTANPNHLPPSSESAIGRTDQANHQYDISDFYDTLKDGNMPSVSFLKPPAYQNGHPANSDPLDEQTFLVNSINQIEQSRFWDSTAVVITYDDSDGWYDHVAPVIVNGSSDPNTDQALCTSAGPKLGTLNNRCGFSQRLPMVVISPYTRTNYVSNDLTDTASVTRFIEDNWLRGERLGSGSFDAVPDSLFARGGVLDFHGRAHFNPVILDPATGAVVGDGHHHH